MGGGGTLLLCPVFLSLKSLGFRDNAGELQRRIQILECYILQQQLQVCCVLKKNFASSVFGC